MSESLPDVVVLQKRIEPALLRRLVERFEDMVKYVVDVERGAIAIGGEMHRTPSWSCSTRDPASAS